MVLGSLAYGQVAPRRHRTIQIYGSFAANDVVTILLLLWRPQGLFGGKAA